MTAAPDVDFALPLEALDDRVAVMRGLGPRQGDTIIAAQTPAGARLLYSGYLLQRKVSPGDRRGLRLVDQVNPTGRTVH